MNFYNGHGEHTSFSLFELKHIPTNIADRVTRDMLAIGSGPTFLREHYVVHHG